MNIWRWFRERRDFDDCPQLINNLVSILRDINENVYNIEMRIMSVQDDFDKLSTDVLSVIQGLKNDVVTLQAQVAGNGEAAATLIALDGKINALDAAVTAAVAPAPAVAVPPVDPTPAS